MKRKSDYDAHNDLTDDNVSLASNTSTSLICKSKTNNKLKNFNYLNNYTPKLKLNLAYSTNANGVLFSTSETNYCLNQHYFNNLPGLHNSRAKLLLRYSNSSLNSITTMNIRYIFIFV